MDAIRPRARPPHAAARRPARQKPPEPRQIGAGKRALVVEMDMAAQILCRDVLTRKGFAVDAVDNGVQALQAARARQPALILMDLQLRDALGLEVVNWLRSNPELRTVPVIGISAADADASQLAANGIATVLHKPLSASAIQRAVHQVLQITV